MKFSGFSVESMAIFAIISSNYRIFRGFVPSVCPQTGEAQEVVGRCGQGKVQIHSLQPTESNRMNVFFPQGLRMKTFVPRDRMKQKVWGNLDLRLPT